MKFTQETISEPKKVEVNEKSEKTATTIPEQKPESSKPVRVVQQESSKMGCFGVAYHTIIGLAVLGLVVSAYNQEERINKLEAQHIELKELNSLQNKKNNELEGKILENLEHLKEMFVWGKAITKNHKSLRDEVKNLTKENAETKDKIQELKKETNSNIIIFNGKKYKIEEIKVKTRG